MHRYIQIFRFFHLPLAGLIMALCPISSNTEVIAKSNPEKKAKRLYKSGIDLKDKGNYEEALSKFKAAVEIYPEYVEATFAGGVASYALGNYEKAKDDFTRITELDTKNKLAYYFRGKTNQTLGELEETLTDFSKVIESVPENASLYFERAIIKSELSDFLGAREDFNNAVDFYRKDLESALDEIYHATSINKMSVNFLEYIYSENGYYGNRNSVNRNWHGKVITRNQLPQPNSPITIINVGKLHDQASFRFIPLQITYMYRGELNYFLGDIDAALGDFSEAFRSKANNRSFGIFNFAIGNYDLTSQSLQHWVAKQPTDYYSRFYLFLALSHLGEHEKAEDYLSITQKKKKRAKQSIWSIQITDFLLGKVDESSFIEAANNDDKYINLEQLCEAFFYTAQVHLLNGNESKAKEYLQKCLLTRISHYYEYMIAIIQLKLRLKNYTAESL